MPISPFDFQQMQQRVDRNRGLKPPESSGNDGCSDESELHDEIRQECLRRGWLAFHGSMAHKTFRTEGEFDFVILCQFPTVLLVECKTKNGKLSEAQRNIHAWANRLGHLPYTVRSIEEFHAIANTVTKNHHDNGASQGNHHFRD